MRYPPDDDGEAFSRYDPATGGIEDVPAIRADERVAAAFALGVFAATGEVDEAPEGPETTLSLLDHAAIVVRRALFGDLDAALFKLELLAEQQRGPDGRFLPGPHAARKGRGKASKAAHDASDKAIDAEKGDPKQAGQLHRDAADAHRKAEKAAKSDAVKQAHREAAEAHEAKAKEHEAKAAKPKTEKPKTERKSEQAKRAESASKAAEDASAKARETGADEDHVSAASAHSAASYEHEQAIAKAKGEAQKEAHAQQAIYHQQQAEIHRTEHYKISRAAQEVRDADRAAPPPAEHHGDHRDVFFGERAGQVDPRLHSEQPGLEDHARALADIRNRLGNMPAPMQKAAVKLGIAHRAIGVIGDSPETAQLKHEEPRNDPGGSWAKYGGVSFGNGQCFTAATKADGATALHEVGHEFDSSGRDGRHTDATWWRQFHAHALSKAPGEREDRLTNWWRGYHGAGQAEYIRQRGDERASRQEVFAEMFSHAYTSKATRANLDKHFPEFRRLLADNLHADWKAQKIV